MWDWVLLVSTLALTPATLPTLFSRDAYVPRLTSGVFCIAITGIATSLFASGLPLGAGASALGSLVWGSVFVLRGNKESI